MVLAILLVKMERVVFYPGYSSLSAEQFLMKRQSVALTVDLPKHQPSCAATFQTICSVVAKQKKKSLGVKMKKKMAPTLVTAPHPRPYPIEMR